MHLTMVFTDGLGMGKKEDNPVFTAHTPNIDRLLGGHLLWGERKIKHKNCCLYTLDTCLGVSGIPQSATGQTTLWTGINGAKLLGKHLNAFPNKELKAVIKEHSIFKQLAERGKRTAFANAFSLNPEKIINQNAKGLSASTLCALAGEVRLRTIEELLAGKAVYQDITNELLQKKGLNVPRYKPHFAGTNLAKISLEHDFTLFEFFQSDVCGHKQDNQKAVRVMEVLDEFLGGYLSVAEASLSQQSGSIDNNKMALIVTSDHGNLEDLTTSSHTLNKVPAICWSNFDLEWPEIQSIAEVTPAILGILDS